MNKDLKVMTYCAFLKMWMIWSLLLQLQMYLQQKRPDYILLDNTYLPIEVEGRQLNLASSKKTFISLVTIQ